MSDLRDRVAELEDKFAFLEDELDVSYEKRAFVNRVEMCFDDSATIEIQELEKTVGYFARVTDIDGDDLQEALDSLGRTDYGTAVTETGSGLGLEIWTE